MEKSTIFVLLSWLGIVFYIAGCGDHDTGDNHYDCETESGGGDNTISAEAFAERYCLKKKECAEDPDGGAADSGVGDTDSSQEDCEEQLMESEMFGTCTDWTYADAQRCIDCFTPLNCSDFANLDLVCDMCFFDCGPFDCKPVIYLYPEYTQEVTVKFKEKNSIQLTHTYPLYGPDGWQVIATPDGILYDLEDNLEYYGLYWEGISANSFDLSEGFVVEGEDTIDFLEEALQQLGLNRREANEFIIYWLPLMEDNSYNFIHFATREWDETVPLDITPQPDSLIRIFMTFSRLEEQVNVPEQVLVSPQRKGFTVVEWGGTELRQ